MEACYRYFKNPIIRDRELSTSPILFRKGYGLLVPVR
jgi:hypothetical protein